MLLAVDTASRMMSVALLDGGQIIAETTQQTQNRHTVQLSECIAQLLANQQRSRQELSVLAISQGVGSYSGLRVGFGVMKGLALALELPLIAVPTLDIVAAGTPFFDGVLHAVIPAGRKRILTQAYHWQGGRWQTDDAVLNTTWQTLIPQLTRPTLINGEVEPATLQSLTDLPPHITLADAPWRVRRAGTLGAIAWQIFLSGNYERNASQVNPIYAKDP